jgi:hypothetical protein
MGLAFGAKPEFAGQSDPMGQDLPAIPFRTRKIGHNGNLRDALAITLRSDGVSMATRELRHCRPWTDSRLNAVYIEQGALNGL